jgi:hypothetical protein
MNSYHLVEIIKGPMQVGDKWFILCRVVYKSTSSRPSLEEVSFDTFDAAHEFESQWS